MLWNGLLRLLSHDVIGLSMPGFILQSSVQKLAIVDCVDRFFEILYELGTRRTVDAKCGYGSCSWIALPLLYYMHFWKEWLYASVMGEMAVTSPPASSHRYSSATYSIRRTQILPLYATGYVLCFVFFRQKRMQDCALYVLQKKESHIIKKYFLSKPLNMKPKLPHGVRVDNSGLYHIVFFHLCLCSCTC